MVWTHQVASRTLPGKDSNRTSRQVPREHSLSHRELRARWVTVPGCRAAGAKMLEHSDPGREDSRTGSRGAVEARIQVSRIHPTRRPGDRSPAAATHSSASRPRRSWRTPVFPVPVEMMFPRR